MTPHAPGKSQATDKFLCPVTMENQPQNIKHEIRGLGTMVSVSHNGGHDDRWNMKMYVIFVLLLKVNR